jgi:hypothetical protein
MAFTRKTSNQSVFLSITKGITKGLEAVLYGTGHLGAACNINALHWRRH